MSDSYEALAVDAQKLIACLKTTVDVCCAASDDRLDVDSQAVLDLTRILIAFKIKELSLLFTCPAPLAATIDRPIPLEFL